MRANSRVHDGLHVHLRFRHTMDIAHEVVMVSLIESMKSRVVCNSTYEYVYIHVFLLVDEARIMGFLCEHFVLFHVFIAQSTYLKTQNVRLLCVYTRRSKTRTVFAFVFEPICTRQTCKKCALCQLSPHFAIVNIYLRCMWATAQLNILVRILIYIY